MGRKAFGEGASSMLGRPVESPCSAGTPNLQQYHARTVSQDEV